MFADKVEAPKVKGEVAHAADVVARRDRHGEEVKQGVQLEITGTNGDCRRSWLETAVLADKARICAYLRVSSAQTQRWQTRVVRTCFIWTCGFLADYISKDITIADPPDDGISSMEFGPTSNLLLVSSWDSVSSLCSTQ